jgi:putative hemolysin
VATTTRTYPTLPAFLPAVSLADGHYQARFARNATDLDAALKLRYEVFNLELNEGLDASHFSQRDEDEFDEQCHHLLVTDTRSGHVIGTYRMQTQEMARAGHGFYSAGEFDLAGFPTNDAVELGRACVAEAHRNSRVLFLLWRGLAAYLAHNRKSQLFGCCSLTSLDAADGVGMFRQLEAAGHLHPTLRLRPQPGYECEPTGEACDVKIPKLMKLYLIYGAKICSWPAIDRAFKTIDFLALINVRELPAETYRFFFRGP